MVDKTEKVVDVRNVRLFHDDTFPSFYRRLDFSPDGKYNDNICYETVKERSNRV